MTCRAFAVLVVTDGTTRINLLDCGRFHLSDWVPTVPGAKGGGTRQSSPLSSGSQLVDWQWEDWIEVFTLTLSGRSQDHLIYVEQELLRLLVKGYQYWTTDWQREEVWLEAKAPFESNVRYAIVKNWQFPRGSRNPFAQPFTPADGKTATDVELTVQHGPWLDFPPGSIGDCDDVGEPYNLEFNATTSEVEVSDNAAIQDLHSGAFTAEAWVRADGYGEGNDGRIFDKTSGLAEGWYFALSSAWGLNFRAYYAGPGQAFSQSGLDDFYNDGEWHHVAAILDYSAGSKIADLFVDGVEVTYLLQQDGGAGLALTDFGNDLYIGNRSANDRTWDGAIGWCRLSSGRRYTVNFTPPERCALPPINAATIAQWIGPENTGVTIDNQEGTAAIDGTQDDCDFNECPPDDCACVEISGDDGTYGRSATCSDEVYIANKHNRAPLTHAYIFDSGIGYLAGNLIGAGTPFNLLPAAPAVGDYVIFGISIAVPATSGPFCSLVFDIQTAMGAGVTATIWEYWNGGWIPLPASLQDNTDAAGAMTGVAFDTVGVNSVHWQQPVDWATKAENGITAYWVRLRVTAGLGLNPPVQQNRDIYSILWPYVEIDNDVVRGDIEALMQVLIKNQSGTVTGSQMTNVVMGLRSLSRGENFTAYINVADEQNPPGITVTTPGAVTSFQTDTLAPSGRSALYNPAGVLGLLTQIRVTLSQAVSRQFYGTYHAYIRTSQDGGSIGDFSAAINAFGMFTTEEVTIRETGVFGLTDLGRLEIVSKSLLDDDDVINSATIDILLANSNAAPGDLEVFDLILIPVDEFGMIASLVTSGALEWNDLLDVDSVMNPRVLIRSIVRDSSDDSILAIWRSITPSHAFLQANTNQRLWVFTYDVADESYPYIGHSVQMYAIDRYLYARGRR